MWAALSNEASGEYGQKSWAPSPFLYLWIVAGKPSVELTQTAGLANQGTGDVDTAVAPTIVAEAEIKNPAVLFVESSLSPVET